MGTKFGNLQPPLSGVVLLTGAVSSLLGAVPSLSGAVSSLSGAVSSLSGAVSQGGGTISAVTEVSGVLSRVVSGSKVPGIVP